MAPESRRSVKIIAGAIQATEGEIFLDGRHVNFTQPSEALAAGISTVYQSLALVGCRSIAANLFLGREPSRFGFVRSREMNAKAEQMLTDLRQLNITEIHAEVDDLSGGQRQAVAIARGVRLGQRVLILDEPTAALGVQGGRGRSRADQDAARHGAHAAPGQPQPAACLRRLRSHHSPACRAEGRDHAARANDVGSDRGHDHRIVRRGLMDGADSVAVPSDGTSPDRHLVPPEPHCRAPPLQPRVHPRCRPVQPRFPRARQPSRHRREHGARGDRHGRGSVPARGGSVRPLRRWIGDAERSRGGPHPDELGSTLGRCPARRVRHRPRVRDRQRAHDRGRRHGSVDDDSRDVVARHRDRSRCDAGLLAVRLPRGLQPARAGACGRNADLRVLRDRDRRDRCSGAVVDAVRLAGVLRPAATARRLA